LQFLYFRSGEIAGLDITDGLTRLDVAGLDIDGLARVDVTLMDSQGRTLQD